LKEKTRYYDFTSLYPYVQKKYRFPILHPMITRGIDECSEIEIKTAFGLIKCKILPPKKLLFPVLPYHTAKLTFPLCRTCAEKLEDHFEHDDDERSGFQTPTRPRPPVTSKTEPYICKRGVPRDFMTEGYLQSHEK
jgi:hypothetical protein